MLKHKVLISLGVALIAILGFQTQVWADGGPHGGYQDTTGGLTDRCAACHRVHQGKSEGKLLKAESPYALCLTCHNGVGSVLNVLDGVKLTALQTVTGLTSRATSTNMSVSVAPYTETWALPGGTAVFTVRVRNSSGGSITATVACDTTGCTKTDPGAIAAGQVGYGTVSVPASATAGTTVTTTITVTESTNNATLVVKTVSQNAISGATLNGGGFRFVNGAATSSRHDANPADNSLKPWGYGGSGVTTSSYLSNYTATNNTSGDVNSLGAALQCTSCHNPHGTANYRLLKETVNGVNVRVRAYYGGAFTKDEGARGLETGAPADKYVAEYYGSSGGPDANNTSLTTATYGIATICGACHTAYPSEGASLSLTAPTVAAGPNAVHYRHRTEMPYTNWVNPETGVSPANPETSPLTGFPALRLASNGTQTNTIVTCLTCHRVHGTATTMSGYALKSSLGGSADDDLSPAQTSASQSVLLFTNNRGMCEGCHRW
ncbi:MAG: cytochrome c3 family protein [Chloroflexi bacterium]|nr:cytochrome c3 family protein [Chloroflexota bacterium]